MKSSTARRSQAQPEKQLPLGWILGGLGVLMMLGSFGIQIMAPTIWHDVLQPQEVDNIHSVYHTSRIRLKPGTYNISLQLRRSKRLFDISLGQFTVRISCPEDPDFLVKGHLSLYKKTRTGGRKSLHGILVARIEKSFDGSLLIDIHDTGKDSLAVSIHKASLDHRVLLWPGILLIVLALLLDPSLRKRLSGLINTGD